MSRNCPKTSLYVIVSDVKVWCSHQNFPKLCFQNKVLETVMCIIDFRNSMYIPLGVGLWYTNYQLHAVWSRYGISTPWSPSGGTSTELKWRRRMDVTFFSAQKYARNYACSKLAERPSYKSRSKFQKLVPVINQSRPIVFRWELTRVAIGWNGFSIRSVRTENMFVLFVELPVRVKAWKAIHSFIPCVESD